MIKKSWFSIKNSIRTGDDPKSDKKHLQTRFPRPPFGQQMRFLSFFAPRLRAAGPQKWRPGGVREASGTLQSLHWSSPPLKIGTTGLQMTPEGYSDTSRELSGTILRRIFDRLFTSMWNEIFKKNAGKYRKKNVTLMRTTEELLIHIFGHFRTLTQKGDMSRHQEMFQK